MLTPRESFTALADFLECVIERASSGVASAGEDDGCSARGRRHRGARGESDEDHASQHRGAPLIPRSCTWLPPLVWFEAAVTRFVDTSFVNGGSAFAFVRGANVGTASGPGDAPSSPPAVDDIISTYQSLTLLVAGPHPTGTGTAAARATNAADAPGFVAFCRTGSATSTASTTALNHQHVSCPVSPATNVLAVAVEESLSETVAGVRGARTVTLIINETLARLAAEHADNKLRALMLADRRAATTNVSENRAKQGEEDEDAAEGRVLLVRLFVAPNHYHCWNRRKQRLLLALDAAGHDTSRRCAAWRREAVTNALMFARLPKSPDAWAHRMWLVKVLLERVLVHSQQVPAGGGVITSAVAQAPPAVPVDADPAAQERQRLTQLLELVPRETHFFAARACAVYRRSYPAWEHRRLAWELVVRHASRCDKLGVHAIVGEARAGVCAELRARLAWFAQHPSDASAVASFHQLFDAAVAAFVAADAGGRHAGAEMRDARLDAIDELEPVLAAAWAQSQRMIGAHGRVARLGGGGGGGGGGGVHVVPQIAHESIWLLRRAVVDLSRRWLLAVSASPAPAPRVATRSNWWLLRRGCCAVDEDDGGDDAVGRGTVAVDAVLFRGWCLSDELALVSVFAESHEAADRLATTEASRGSAASTAGSDTVLCIPLQADLSLADQGQFAALFALQYGASLLRPSSCDARA